MAEPATNPTTPASEPAPAPTPAPAPSSTPEAAPAPGQEPGAGSPPEAAAPLPPLTPEPVPYAKFREAQTAATRYRRQMQAAEQRWQEQIQEREREWIAERERLNAQAENFAAMQSVLEQHPDLADQLYERLGTGGQARPQQQPPVAQLPPELVERLSKIDDVTGYIERAERRERQAAFEAGLRETQSELNTSVKKILTDRRYQNVDKLTPLASNYVLWRVRNMGPDAEVGMDVVPALLAEFLMPLEEEYSARLDGYRQGKVADRATNPAVPGGAAPGTLATRPTAGANDSTTARRLEERLRAMGWSDGG